jgi:hypothetical protein
VVLARGLKASETKLSSLPDARQLVEREVTFKRVDNPASRVLTCLIAGEIAAMPYRLGA